MKAQVLKKYGDYDVLEYTDFPLRAINDNEVLIKVSSCSINNTDIWTRIGLYSKDDGGAWEELKFPLIQGADIVGTVIEGPKLLNKRVIVYPVINNDPDEIRNITDCTYIGSGINGGYAEYCIVPQENIYEIPSTCILNDFELACIPTAYMTAYYMLHRANVKSTDTCIITGASGGVGLALIQLLKLRNIKTIGICSSDKSDILINEGLFDCVDRTNKTDKYIYKELLEKNDNKLYDVAFDVVAGDLTEHLLELLKNNGNYICSGAIGGRSVNIHWPTFYLKHLNLYGSMLCTRVKFEELLQLVFSNQIKPKVDKIFKLENLIDAQKTFDKKKFIGKIVLDCN